MKVLHLNHSDSIGGAAKFANRLHHALLNSNHDSFMCCSSVKVVNPRVFRVQPDVPEIYTFAKAKFAQTLDSKITKLEFAKVRQFKSPGWIGSVNSKWINDSDFDVVNLHWVNGGLMSIKEIGKITKPIIWSMLDMWPFLGGEHYSDSRHENRWSDGYTTFNRAKFERGVDISKISAGLKRISWSQNISFVSPSKWLASAAEQSQLLRDFQISVIPAAINTSLFSPDQAFAGRIEGPRKFVIGYGGAFSSRKGWQLFNEFLNTFERELAGSRVITFGAPVTAGFSSPYYEIVQMGQIKTEAQLVNIYRDMDVLVFPSIQETFGLIAQEAQSCGVPVVCLKETGTEEVINSGHTGFSIDNNVQSLIQALLKLMRNVELRWNFSENARSRALSCWGQEIVANQYVNLYQSRLEG